MPVPTAEPPSPISRSNLRLLLDRLLRALDRAGVGMKLLAQPHRNCIHHVGAAGFQNVMKLFTFFFQRGDEAVERGIQFFQFQQRGQTHRSGEDVVGRLPVVDVVVGMNVLVLAQRAAQQLGGAVGDDLVAVHVEADAGARLKDVHDELLVPLALLDFFGGFDDGVGGLLVHQAEVAIGERSSFLHHRDGADERGMGAQSADGKVLHRARRLNAVVNLGGNFLVAERVFLVCG